MREKKQQSPINFDISDIVCKKLSMGKIYFGHQSVGYNIMEGLQEILNENPRIQLKVIETNSVSDIMPGSLAHSKIGKNREPVTKIEEFEALMESGLGNIMDVAFFKFCYVDIEEGTDIQAIFKQYNETVSRLQRRFPRIRFIHVTTPLTTVEPGIKAWIKKMLGRLPYGYKENILRNQYNQLLIELYKGKGTIFDLAGIESMNGNGKKITCQQDEVTFQVLNPEYTKDGGHLNKTGRRVVAQHLLQTLANLANDL